MKCQDDAIPHQAHTNKYAISRLIGSGAFGKVFKAKCVATGKNVAIKYIEFKDTGDDHLVAVCREAIVNAFLTNQSTNCFSVPLIDIYFPKRLSPATRRP